MRIQSRKQNDTVKEERTKIIRNEKKRKELLNLKNTSSGMQAKKNKNKILNVLPMFTVMILLLYIIYSIQYVERKKERKNLNKKFSTKRKSKKIG